jgi:tetratricopeptide (TPR) repeat protein
MTDSKFLQAVDLHRQGRLDEAAAGYQAVIETEEHAGALLHLGVLRLAQGRGQEAQAVLRRALAVAPQSAETHANLAAALQASGQHDEAVRHYEISLTLNPGMAQARFGLAACLQALGRQEAAEVSYRELLAVEPAHPEANYGIATLLAETGRDEEAMSHYRLALDADVDFAEAAHGLGNLLVKRRAAIEAIEYFHRALDVDPDYDEARLSLAGALLRLERDDEATAAYRAVLTRQPENAVAHRGLGMLLGRNRKESESIEHFQAALALEPNSVAAMNGMAAALIALGRHAEAVELCRRASALEPDNADVLATLGRALLEVGDTKQAEALTRRAVELAPDRPEFAFSRVQFGRIAQDDGVIAALEALLPLAWSLTPREQCWLQFALAKAYDDAGDRDRGFAHLIEGNALKRRQIEYDEPTAIGLLNRVAQVFSANMMASRRGLGHPSEVPIFIVGMPRSGTTLVEQILASHPAVFGAGELTDLPNLVREMEAAGRAVMPLPESLGLLTGQQLSELGKRYVARVRPFAPGALHITDKLPGNFVWVGLIHLALPNARIVHLIRDPVDTCLSCFSKLFSYPLSFTYDLGELGRYHSAYRRLMAHWRAVLPTDAMMEVHYEALVANLADEARRLIDYCQLPWDDACLRFHQTNRIVRTASVTQVRQPIYSSSVGRWRPDAALLRPLLEGLGVASL